MLCRCFLCPLPLFFASCLTPLYTWIFSQFGIQCHKALDLLGTDNETKFSSLGQELELSKSVTHLGHILTHDLSDNEVPLPKSQLHAAYFLLLQPFNENKSASKIMSCPVWPALRPTPFSSELQCLETILTSYTGFGHSLIDVTQQYSMWLLSYLAYIITSFFSRFNKLVLAAKKSAFYIESNITTDIEILW